MQQSARPKVDVEIESGPQSQQNVACVFVPGNAWVAEGAEEYRIDIITEMFVDSIGEGLAGDEVVTRTVGQVLPGYRGAVGCRRGLDDWNGDSYDFGSDAVASDDGDRDAAIQRITFPSGRRM